MIRRVLGLLPLLLVLLSALPGGVAHAASCPAQNPSPKYESLTPYAIQMPIWVPGDKGPHPSVTFHVGLGPLHVSAGSVTFAVVCGPDAPQKGASIATRDLAQWSGAKGATWTLVDRGVTGTDVITSEGRYDGKTITATSWVSWVEPDACQSIGRLGFVAALSCAKDTAKSVLNLTECAASALTVEGTGAARLLRVLDAATTLKGAEAAARDGASATALAKLAYDLRHLGGGVTLAKLRAAFAHAHSVEGTIKAIAALLNAVGTGNYSDIAKQLASLAGFGSCADLLSDTVVTAPTPPASTTQTTTTPTPTPTPSVPGSGPTFVLSDVGSIATSPYTSFASATGQTIAGGSSLPSDLLSYRCVLFGPLSDEGSGDPLDSADTTALTQYMQEGGTIVAVGAGWPPFVTGGGYQDPANMVNGVLNPVAAALGATGLKLADDTYDEAETTSAIASNPLTSGVSTLGYGIADEIDVSAPAIPLAYLGDATSKVLLAAQAIGKGWFLLGSGDLFSNSEISVAGAYNNSVLARDLCP
jgi:hypothetical protein